MGTYMVNYYPGGIYFHVRSQIVRLKMLRTQLTHGVVTDYVEG